MFSLCNSGVDNDRLNDNLLLVYLSNNLNLFIN
jgi:hypothetical protein